MVCRPLKKELRRDIKILATDSQNLIRESVAFLKRLLLQQQLLHLAPAIHSFKMIELQIMRGRK